MHILQVGDPVCFTTDKAYKYSGQRFYIKEIKVDGSMLLGRKKDNLCDIWTLNSEGVWKALKGQNKAVYR